MFEEKNYDCNDRWIKIVLLYKFGKTYCEISKSGPNSSSNITSLTSCRYEQCCKMVYIQIIIRFYFQVKDSLSLLTNQTGPY